MPEPKKILFVCLGNICRSPLAEAIFKKKIKDRKIEHLFIADSCGTSNYHIGHTPDPRTIRNAEKNGVDIQHLGRQLVEHDLHSFDIILAMDKNNLYNIHKLPAANEFAYKIKLLREYDTEEPNGEVPDPYYGTEQDFQKVFDILDRSVSELLNNISQ